MRLLLLAAIAAGQDLVAITNSLRRAFPEEPWTFLAIDLGAGVRDDDPVFGILDDDERWRGVLVDGDPAQGPKMAERFPRQTTMVSYITPDTVVDLVRPYINESKPDVVKLDIDSFDCSVLRVIFRELRPRIVVSEVNVKFAPDTSFALLNSTHCARAQPYDSEKRAWTYGCSLRFQHDHVAQPLGYALERLAWNNAVYVRRDLLAHSVVEGSLAEWDRIGYFARPERSRKFAFNEIPMLQKWRAPGDRIQAIVDALNDATLPNYACLSALLGRAGARPRRYCWDARGSGFGPCAPGVAIGPYGLAFTRNDKVNSWPTGRGLPGAA